MMLDNGAFKYALIGEKWVFKFPIVSFFRPVSHSILSILEIYSEHFVTVFCPVKYRHFIAPVYFIPLVPFSIQRKLTIYTDWEDKAVMYDALLRRMRAEGLLEENFNKTIWLDDIHEGNIGIAKGGKILRFDYGFFHSLSIVKKLQDFRVKIGGLFYKEV